MLDVLRGVAVLAVIALHNGDHVQGHGLAWFDAWLWPVLRHGYLGVQLFFVISGYCIIGAVDSAQRSATPLASYVRRRLRRIYPPYWCSLVLTVLLGLVTVVIARKSWHDIFPLTTWDWLLNLVLLQRPFNAPDAGMVYWSLSIEVQFYAVMALCLLWPRWRSLGLVALSAAYVAWVWRPIVPISGTPFAYWPEFACGIAAYAAHHRHGFWKGTPELLWGLTAAGVASWFMQVSAVTTSDGEFVTGYKQAFCLICGLLVYGLKSVDGAVDRIGLLRLLAAVGTISYSLYLTHVPLGSRVFNLLERFVSDQGWSCLMMTAAALLVQFAGGWLFYHWCERPWLNASSTRPNVEHAVAVVATPSCSGAPAV